MNSTRRGGEASSPPPQRAATGRQGVDSISPRRDIGALLFAMGLPTLVTWAYFVALARHPAAMQQAAYTVGKIIQFGFPAVWVFLIARERPGWAPPRWRGMAPALAFGLLVAAAMLAIYHLALKPSGDLADATAEVREKVAGFGIASLGLYVAFALFYSLAHSLLEEYYWRWFVFGRLRKYTHAFSAVLLSSLAFMAHHVIVLAVYFGWNSPTTYVFSLGVAVGGAAWAWIYQRSQSLYACWLSHLFVDAAIFVVGFDMVGDLFG